jgi:hypothetical protein
MGFEPGGERLLGIAAACGVPGNGPAAAVYDGCLAHNQQPISREASHSMSPARSPRQPSWWEPLGVPWRVSGYRQARTRSLLIWLPAAAPSCFGGTQHHFNLPTMITSSHGQICSHGHGRKERAWAAAKARFQTLLQGSIASAPPNTALRDFLPLTASFHSTPLIDED